MNNKKPIQRGVAARDSVTFSAISMRWSLCALLLSGLLTGAMGTAIGQSCGALNTPFATMGVTTNESKHGFVEYTNAQPPKIAYYLTETKLTLTNYYKVWSEYWDGAYHDGQYGHDETTPGYVFFTTDCYYSATNIVTKDTNNGVFTSNYFGGFRRSLYSNRDSRVTEVSAFSPHNYEQYSNACSISTNLGLLGNGGWANFTYEEKTQYTITNYNFGTPYVNRWETNALSSGSAPSNFAEVVIVGDLVTLEPAHRLYAITPTPPNGGGTTTYDLTSEFTTPQLKQQSATDLASIGYDSATFSGQTGQAYFALSNTETNLDVGKMRYCFQYETTTNTTYELTKRYTIWTNGVVISTNVTITTLIEGDGGTHSVTNEIAPIFNGSGMVLKEGDRVLVGEIALSVAVAVKDITIKPYNGSAASCSSCSSGNSGFGTGGPYLARGAGLSFSLGATTNGQAVGGFRVEQDELDPIIYKPSGLSLLAPSNRVTVVTNTDGTLRQIGASQCLVDILTLTAGGAYSLTFYPASAYYPSNGNDLISTNGLSADVTWIIENPDSSSSNRLRVCEVRGSMRTTNLFTWTSASQEWSLLAGNGIKQEVLSKSWDINHIIRTETRQIIDPSSSQVAAQTTSKYQLYTWGEGMVQEIQGGGTGGRTISYGYYPDGKLQSATNADGGVQIYSYDSAGRITKVDSTLGDTVGGGSGESVYYSYADTAGLQTYGDNTNLWPTRPRITSGNAYQNFFLAINADENIEVRAASWSGNPFASGNLCTTNRYYPAGTADATKLKSVEHPDGTMTICTYGHDGNAITNTVATGVPNGGRTDIASGTRTVTVTSAMGEVLRQEVYDISSNGTLLVSQEIYNYTDALKRSYWVAHLDGTSNLVQYACCGLELTQDRDGTITQYYNDALKRQVASQNISLSITTSNVLDAAGRVIQSLRIGSDGSRVTIFSSAYDLAGQLTSQTNALWGVTSYTYGMDGGGHTVRTITNPDGGQRIETLYKDGQLYQVTGSATQPVRYSYTSSSTTETKLDDNGNATSEVTITHHDILGRQDYIQYPNSRQSNFYYNDQGQLQRQADPDNVTTLFQYNSKGEREYTAVDMDMYRNNVIDFNGTDRITRTVSDVVTNYGTCVRRIRTYVWPTNGVDAAFLASMTETSVDGLRSWQTVWNSGTAVTNCSQTAYTGNGYRYTTNTAPDGSYMVSQVRYGQQLAVTRFDPAGNQLSRTSYVYDEHGRQRTVTDARNGTATLYYNNADLLNAVTTPAPGDGSQAQTTTTYYNTMLQATNVVQPDGTSVFTTYHPSGLLKKTWGSRSYTVEYTYDFAGRMKTMTTWQNANDSSTAATTTWNYNSYGQMMNKRYADNNGPTYYYTSASRLLYRIWKRNNLYAWYSYNNAGDLSDVQYGDGTPSVHTDYDRSGRPEVVTQGSNVTTNRYSDAGLLLSEIHGGGPLNGLVVSNQYDGLLRRTNITVYRSPSTAIASTAYSFDSASRPQTVTSGSSSATYTYLANSMLVSNIVFKQASTTRMTTSKSYDLLNRLQQISSVPSASTALSFSYQNNAANQRSRSTLVDGSYWVYEYDLLGQVKSGKRYWNDGTPVAGQQFEYAFDDIGNRQSSKTGGDQTGANLASDSYGANLLNQYTNRTVSGTVEVTGVALATNQVTVNGTTSYRKGEYFWTEASTNNTSAASWFNIFINSAGSNVTGNVFLPKTPEGLAYDEDGNLDYDGRWDYTWDAENRLTGIERIGSAPDAAKVRLDCQYDERFRRIQKVVSTWNGFAYVAQSTNRFVYDGWNLISVLDVTNGLVQSFSWGSDLSGSPQGAGAVGGLLSMRVYTGSNQGTYFYCFDGNGNVVGLVDTNGVRVAEYEYGPFGEVIRATGPMARVNPFRWSTQYTDDETDLVMYPARPYSPSTGRWLSRDPIGEMGGVNVYASVGNNPVSRIDSLGLAYGNPVSGPGGMWPSDPYAPGGAYYVPPAPPAGWGGAIGNGLDWGFGHSGGDTHYGPNSPQSQEMSQSSIAGQLRGYFQNKYKDKLCKDWGGVTNYKTHFRVFHEVISDMGNGTAEFVGDAAGEVAINGVDLVNCKVNARFKFTNTTSLKSLLYGRWPNSWNVTTPGRPFSNWTQTYEWDESFNCKCCTFKLLSVQ